jgi:putative CocE/NonD family hydrolase
MQKVKMIEEKNFRLTMRDGVEISIRIYRPDAPGRFPCLFASSPYQHHFNDVPAFPIFLWRETGPIEWYIARGYAYAHADVRGTGQSTGEFGFLDINEQLDNVEIIEWLAEQPWCNGRIGGIGQSYYAFSQWLTATHNPRGLACIVPFDGLIDQYRCSNYHGGILCNYRPWWWIMMLSNNQNRLAGARNRPRIKTDLVGDIVDHTLYDDWWKERSAHERLAEIKIPVLSIGHWGKMGLHLRGNILGYEELRSPKKLVVTGARSDIEAHHLFDQIEFHEREMLPFYEHYLKDVDNGFMEGNPVKLYVRGAEIWREEAAWPLPRATYVPWYLTNKPSNSVTSINDGGLAIDAPTSAQGDVSYAYPDWDWRFGVVALDPKGRPDPVRRVLTFTSEALEKDLEVTGPIVLKLFASSDQIDTNFVIKLSDQHPQDAAARASGEQPGSTPVSKGWLKASHREKDEQRTTPMRPFYTHANPQPLEPGKVYEFDIEVMPISYVFKKGHRIRLEIVNGDSSMTDGVYNHPYHPSLVGADTIYMNSSYASRILLPIVAGQ